MADTQNRDAAERAPAPAAGGTRRSALRRGIIGCARALRTGWIVVGVALLMLVALELVCAIGYKALRSIKYHAKLDPRLTSPIYADTDWAVAYFGSELRASQQMQWEPYVYWRRKPFAGKLINVDDGGHRRTINHAASDAPVRVFCLGGSTMWGTGVRDAYTLPSLIARNLAGRGLRNVYVENLGESGYVTTQELILLQLRLRAGDVPDVALFYDGANDLFSAFQNGSAGLPQNERNRAKKFDMGPGRLLRRWIAKSYTMKGIDRVRRALRPRSVASSPQTAAPLPTDDAALARQAVRTYFANVRLVRALAREYGFEVVFIWQPLLPYKDPMGRWERGLYEQLGKQAAFYKEGNEEFRRVHGHNARAGVHDLSRMFAGQTQDVFWDLCHVSESANRQIADRIAELISPLVARAAASRPSVGRRATQPATRCLLPDSSSRCLVQVRRDVRDRHALAERLGRGEHVAPAVTELGLQPAHLVVDLLRRAER